MKLINSIIGRSAVANTALTCLLLIFTLLVSSSAYSEPVKVVTYYHNNLQGSPFAASIESASGSELLWTQSYTPYGFRPETASEAANKALNRVGYTGHIEDKYSHNQLTYAQGRFYDPTIGRFLSIDPVSYTETNPMTFNRYAYGNNNPYLYTDPDGEFVFLIPVLTFIAKEVAAEALSRATNGATDFLSVRRLATKALKKGRSILTRKSCSFHAETEVLTDRGFIPIHSIVANTDRVLSKNERSGDMSWQTVLDHYSNEYAQTVNVFVYDPTSDVTYKIVSNTIHPFFSVRPTRSHLVKTSQRQGLATSEAGDYQGNISGGQWVVAAELSKGDKLLAPRGSWVSVAQITVEDETLTAYNLDVSNDDSFFVRGAEGVGLPVWVHNCDGASGVSDIVENGKRGRASEARVLEDMGLPKNTSKVSTSEGNAIPDSLTSRKSVEIKDCKSVSCTKQIRIETGAAKASEVESVLVTGKKTKVSKPAERAFDRIIRRKDLGPK